MPTFKIISVDGNEAAERLLNETVGPTTRLVQAHIQTVTEGSGGEQDNILLGTTVTRFTFIFSTD